MPEPTTTVTITIQGVNHGHLARLQTAIKTNLTRFGTSIAVDDGMPKKGK